MNLKAKEIGNGRKNKDWTVSINNMGIKPPPPKIMPDKSLYEE